MLILKQSTSIDIRVGPFVDATDGVTPETGITLGAADQAEVLKFNGAATAAMAGAFAAVTGADGWYDYTVAAGDVDTVGEVVFVVQDSSVCLPVFVRAQVVEESTYDSLFLAGSSDIADILVDTGTTLDTKLNDIQGATFATGTDSLEAIRDRGDAAWTGGATTSDSGTAQAGAAGSITLQSGASAIDNTYIGQLVFINSGTGAGQSRAIDGYTGSSKIATIIGTWATNPDATSVYEIFPADIDEIVAAPTAAAVADAVWDENTAGHTTGGTFGEQCKNDIDAILVDTGDMQPKFGAPAVTLAADLAAVKAETVLILADTAEIGTAGAGLTGLGGMSAGMKAEVNAEVDGALNTAIPGGPTANSINERLAAIDDLTQAAGSGDLAAILVDTGTTLAAAIAALNDLSAANVNAEMVDVLATDTYVEPGQELPASDTSLANKINYLYKAWRNRSNQTATLYQLFADNATTVDQKAVVSDNATTAEKGEVQTGP